MVGLWNRIVLEAADNTRLGLRPPRPSMERRFRVHSSSPVMTSLSSLAEDNKRLHSG
jgi:hypothetical protein